MSVTLCLTSIVFFIVYFLSEHSWKRHEAAYDQTMVKSLDPNSAKMFKETLYGELVKHCQYCHGTRHPVFISNDYVWTHNQLIGYSMVSLSRPEDSLIVTKLMRGHQYFTDEKAMELLVQIVLWGEKLKNPDNLADTPQYLASATPPVTASTVKTYAKQKAPVMAPPAPIHLPRPTPLPQQRKNNPKAAMYDFPRPQISAAKSVNKKVKNKNLLAKKKLAPRKKTL